MSDSDRMHDGSTLRGVTDEEWEQILADIRHSTSMEELNETAPYIEAWLVDVRARDPHDRAELEAILAEELKIAELRLSPGFGGE